MIFKSKSKAKIKDEIRLALAEAQDWTCPLSGVKFINQDGRVIDPTTNKAVSVDHDHSTGLIRGILIQKVNWLVDQWEQGSYGYLTKPEPLTIYQQNPPAFESIGQVNFNDYWN